MKNRPRHKIKLNNVDWTFEIVGLTLLLTTWGWTLYNYNQLPDIIPTHYDFSGVADKFGDKWLILTLPLVATTLFVGLTILNKFPHIFNYPSVITVDNALKQYTLATKFIRHLKTSITAIFGIISFQTIRHSLGLSDGLGIWFIPIMLGLVFIPIFYFLIKSSQHSS